jgi:pimeloyl-ACP methyl ester carboxylesterase
MKFLWAYGVRMPFIQAPDRTKLYYEEVGTGSAVIFVHEFAGDYRTWVPQLRHFARSHRCITFSQRGYPPSDVPEDPARYSQEIARDDVIALLDGLAIDKAHIAGHSMGGTPRCMSASACHGAASRWWPPVSALVHCRMHSASKP